MQARILLVLLTWLFVARAARRRGRAGPIRPAASSTRRWSTPPRAVPPAPRGEYPEDWAECVAETQPAWPTAPAGIDPRGVDPALPNPLLGQRFFLDRMEPAYMQWARWKRAGETAKANTIWKLAREPRFRWFGKFTEPAHAEEDPRLPRPRAVRPARHRAADGRHAPPGQGLQRHLPRRRRGRGPPHDAVVRRLRRVGRRRARRDRASSPTRSAPSTAWRATAARTASTCCATASTCSRSCRTRPSTSRPAPPTGSRPRAPPSSCATSASARCAASCST